jgi:hypothetical protein
MPPDIIAFIAGAFASLLGSLTTHFLSKDISRRNNFNKAADEFFAAFKNELTRLKSDGSITTYDIINPALTKHLEACSMFRRYLKGRKLGHFKLAQHKYYFSRPSQDESETEQEDDELLSQKCADERTAIIERIEELLDFAKI